MKKMLKKLVCLVMVVMVLVATSTTIWVSAYDNLIPSANSHFDTGSVWSAGGAGTSDATVYRGSSGKSMKVTDNDATKVKNASITNIGTIYKDRYYRLVYWVRTDVAGTTTRFQWNNYDSNNTQRGFTIITTTPTANTWTKVERTITPLATEGSNVKHTFATATGTFNLFAYATDDRVDSKGTAWYDDVTLTEYDPDTYTIDTPTYTKATGAVSVNITNNFTAVKSATVIVAQYKLIDGKPYLEDVQTEAVTLAVGSTNPISKTFASSADPTSFVKVFLWDGLTDMKPLANAVQSQ